MSNIKVKNIFAAVFEKSVLDEFLDALSRVGPSRGSDPQVRFWGTEGTVKYLSSKGFSAHSVVAGFDYDGRVKSLDRLNFVRILADRTNPKHLEEVKREAQLGHSRPDRESDPRFREDDRSEEPFDLVIVDLYVPNPKIFPESMDIGGQTLIRAAIKNYQNVALAFDEKSIGELVSELKASDGSTSLEFRKAQAKKATKFISQRTKLESSFFEKL